MTSFQANAPISNEAYTIANGATSTDPFITVFQTRDPTPNDANYPVKKRWINFSTPIKEWVLKSFSNSTGQTLANWVLLSSGGAISVESIQVDVSVPPGVNPVTPNSSDIIDVGQSFASHVPITTGTNAASYQTVTRALNEFGIELQLAGSNPSVSTPNNFGISQFDANQFTVTSGFVQLIGSTGPALTKLGVQTGTNPVVPDNTGKIQLNGSTVLAGTNPIRTDGTGVNTATIEVQISQALSATDATKIGLSNFSSGQFIVDGNGFVQLKGGITPALLTLSDDTDPNPTPAIVVTPFTNGNIQLQGHVQENGGASSFSTVVGGTNLLKINPMSASRWIVDPLGFNGTHITIASAMISAFSGDTIFLLPGTYTENVTLKAGVNLTAFTGDSITPIVNIVGTLSGSYTGTVTVSNIRLTTNSTNVVSLTGANATVLNLNNCYLNCSNNTGISSAGSNAASNITLRNCQSNLGTTGIALFAISNGSIIADDCSFGNSGGSTTASTISSSATGQFSNTLMNIPITTSNTAGIGFFYCSIDTSGINTTALTINGTGASSGQYLYLGSGTATPLSIGSGAAFVSNVISLNSANAVAVTGAGTFTYGVVNQSATVGTISVTTIDGKGHVGINNGTAPAVGYIGQLIRSNVATPGSSLSTGTPANVTSISLTPGTWLITGTVVFTGVLAGTYFIGSTNTTTANIGTAGTDYILQGYVPTSGLQDGVAVPAKVVTIAATTTYFLVAQAAFTSGTVTAYGYIQGIRIA